MQDTNAEYIRPAFGNPQELLLFKAKAPELKRYLSGNSGQPHGANAHSKKARKQNLLPPTRHGNAPVSTQVPFQLRGFALYAVFFPRVCGVCNGCTSNFLPLIDRGNNVMESSQWAFQFTPFYRKNGCTLFCIWIYLHTVQYISGKEIILRITTSLIFFSFLLLYKKRREKMH